MCGLGLCLGLIPAAWCTGAAEPVLIDGSTSAASFRPVDPWTSSPYTVRVTKCPCEEEEARDISKLLLRDGYAPVAIVHVSDGYVVLVGAFSDERAARSLISALRDSGRAVFGGTLLVDDMRQSTYGQCLMVTTEPESRAREKESRRVKYLRYLSLLDASAQAARRKHPRTALALLKEAHELLPDGPHYEYFLALIETTNPKSVPPFPWASLTIWGSAGILIVCGVCVWDWRRRNRQR